MRVTGCETFDEMAATIAHEIKNPVAVALAHIKMIRMDDSEQRYDAHCSHIEKELKKISDMALDLLGAAVSEPRSEIDLNRFLSDMVNGYASAYPGISFQFTESSQVIINAGKKKLAVIFSNLIKNAAEATVGLKQPVIAVALSADEGRVVVTVEDNGCGLTAVEMERIAAGGYTSKPGGTGLGLAIVKSAVEALGGEFYLKNIREGGAVATVYIYTA